MLQGLRSKAEALGLLLALVEIIQVDERDSFVS